MEITTRQAATFRAAIECWKEEMAEGGEWIQESLFFANHSPLSIAEIDELSERLDAVIGKGRKMQETRLSVPTYNYQLYPKYVASGEKPEFGSPETPVVIREEQGVRIVLGTYDYDGFEQTRYSNRTPSKWLDDLSSSVRWLRRQWLRVLC